MPTFLALLGMFISVLMIGIILLQRGRGGGLVGALSGLGGQSAFGTKAGDMFTRITIGIAAAWVLLAGIHGQVLRAKTQKFKNAATEIGIPAKDKDGRSTKSDDSKSTSDDSKSGLGTSSKLNDDGEKDSETPPKTKAKAESDESTKEITPEDDKKKDDKKSDTPPKSTEPPKKDLEDPADAKSSEDKGDDKK